MERAEMTEGILMHWFGTDRKTRDCIMRYFVDISDDDVLRDLRVFTENVV